MIMNVSHICIGHKIPDFTLDEKFIFLSPEPIGIENEIVIRDDRFEGGHGGSLAEYSQLFGLADLIVNGTLKIDMLNLFQYRKFISPYAGGYQSVASWVKVISPQQAHAFFPKEADLRNFKGDLIIGSVLDFSESISNSYAKVHVIDDLVCFAAACAESKYINEKTIKNLSAMTGIIPSPALCYIKTDIFLHLMEILKDVSNIFLEKYHTPREGYQRRSTGYLLERLHGILIFDLIQSGAISDCQIWNRYVINTEI